MLYLFWPWKNFSLRLSRIEARISALENKPKSIADIANKYASLRATTEGILTVKYKKDANGRFCK